MAITTPAIRADLRVDVARNDRGDLRSGVERRLARIDGVERIESVRIRGIRPGLNDVRVDVTVRLRLVDPPDDPGTVETLIGAPFGVEPRAITLDPTEHSSRQRA